MAQASTQLINGEPAFIAAYARARNGEALPMAHDPLQAPQQPRHFPMGNRSCAKSLEPQPHRGLQHIYCINDGAMHKSPCACQEK